MKELILKSFMAGFLIGLAGWIYLQCKANIIEPYGSIIGSAMFSIGLYAVCVLKAKLYTGVIGEVNSISTFLEDCIILVLNIAMAALLGVIYRYTIGEVQVFSNIISQPWYKVFFEGFVCGVLIYLAVTIYKQTKNPISIILGVMAFILSGSLHSIACSFYIMLGDITWQAIGYLILIILGNSFGSIITRLLYNNKLNYIDSK